MKMVTDVHFLHLHVHFQINEISLKALQNTSIENIHEELRCEAARGALRESRCHDRLRGSYFIKCLRGQVL